MNQNKTVGTELHYYSGRLKRKLNQLHTAPAAVVEAPSGYGKTTAIRDFLDFIPAQGTCVYWFTAVEETPAAGFQRLSRTVDKIDRKAGQRLMKIEQPNAANTGEVCDALRSVECACETFLVIDNFHLLQDDLPASLFKALLEHRCSSLHIVIITQILSRELLPALSSCGILHLTTADLRLNPEDIRHYYSSAGLHLPASVSDKIFSWTEGWVIAVYLQLCSWADTGSVTDTAGVQALMEHLVWDTLTENQQTFLMRLSPFKVVTLHQACYLTGCSTLPGYAQEALRIPFIHYDAIEHKYEIHSIFSDLLAQERLNRGPQFERECLLLAGDYCRKAGETARAFDFFFRIEAYEQMLSLDFTGIMYDKIGNRPFFELALLIAQNCPEEMKRNNILSMLRIAWALLSAGKTSEFDLLMNELRQIIEEAAEKTAEGSDAPSRLFGEWLLLSSWRMLPDLKKMTELVKRALPLLKGACSQVILPSAPWCFGDYSQLAIFHGAPGEADREADALEEFITIYSGLTGGHGSGSDVLFRAELAHYRGNLNEAEVLAYKAGFIAESRQQSMVLLGASLHLAEIAVEKSDLSGWQNAIDSMERAASFSGQNNSILRAVTEMIRALLLNELNQQQHIPHWLKKGDVADNLPPRLWNNALFIRSCYLMHEGEFTKLTGLAEAACEALRSEDVLGDTLLSLLAAIGYISLGNEQRSKDLVEHAAERALPDGLIYLFAVYYWMLKGQTEDIVRLQYPEQLDRFLEIKERFLNGFTTLNRGLAREELPGDLTEREREVALLASSGLRNHEIADELYISESTVRAHMRVIFQKLDIDRRAKLAEKLK